MKGLILEHKKTGVQIMDTEGFFYFVRGFTDRPLGSEIEFSEKEDEEKEPRK